MSISAVVITRNEAAHIQACLATLGFADEVIVVASPITEQSIRRLGALLPR